MSGPVDLDLVEKLEGADEMLRAAACGVLYAEVQTVPLSLCFNANMTRVFGCSHEGQGVGVDAIPYVHLIHPYLHKHVHTYHIYMYLRHSMHINCRAIHHKNPFRSHIIYLHKYYFYE